MTFAHTTMARTNYIGRNVPDEVASKLILERMHANTVKAENGCWLWQGTLSWKGYGQISYRGKNEIVHRLSYRLFKGEIPTKHHVCHACDTPACWNPDHLWAGTNQENMLDCSRKGRADRQWQTHCKRGHEYNEQNTAFINVGKTVRRSCRLCQRVIGRIRQGWPVHLAETLPAIPAGRSYKDII